MLLRHIFIQSRIFFISNMATINFFLHLEMKKLFTTLLLYMHARLKKPGSFPLQNFCINVLKIVLKKKVVMGLDSGPRPGPSLTQARPFLEDSSPVLIEGPKPGPARARRQKPGGLEGLL